MLTRLEVNGFKNLIDFSIDFSAFNCIAGLNGVGKSNIFDAIKFLSLIADNDLYKAAMEVRESNDGNDPRDIFFTDGENRVKKITFAVEMILKPEVTDDFSRKTEVTSTYLRYEVEIGYSTSELEAPRLELINEKLNYLTKGYAVKKIKFPCSAKDFRDTVIINKRRGKEFISKNVAEDGVLEIHIHQDKSSGRPLKIPASKTPRTVLSNINSIEHPTILAAKREMTSWRFISLEPTAMRRSNSYHDTNTISSNGNHLASTLHKLSLKNKSVCGIIARKLNDITRVENVRVDIDKARELLTLEVKERSGAYIPARGLSDGTLRFLALCIMSEDPDFNGLLCFEEPENGIHPAKMNAMFELLHELAIDVHDSVSDDNPMRQMIIATHSPVMVQLQNKDDLLYADVVKVKGPFGKPVSTIRCRPLQGTWRDSADIDSVDAVSKSSIIAYLTAPVNAQLSLDSYLDFYEN